MKLDERSKAELEKRPEDLRIIAIWQRFREGMSMNECRRRYGK